VYTICTERQSISRSKLIDAVYIHSIISCSEDLVESSCFMRLQTLDRFARPFLKRRSSIGPQRVSTSPPKESAHDTLSNTPFLHSPCNHLRPMSGLARCYLNHIAFQLLDSARIHPPRCVPFHATPVAPIRPNVLETSTIASNFAYRVTSLEQHASRICMVHAGSLHASWATHELSLIASR
jgi:hypothetical protein